MKNRLLVLLTLLLLGGTAYNLFHFASRNSASSSGNSTASNPWANLTVNGSAGTGSSSAPGSAGAASSAPATLQPNEKNFSGPVTLPATLSPVEDYLNRPTATDQTDAEAWYRAELYRQQMWSTGDTSVESHLMRSDGVDGAFGNVVSLIKAANGKSSLQGSVTYHLFDVLNLTSAEQSLLVDVVSQPENTALLVQEVGPESVIVGTNTADIIAAPGNEYVQNYLYVGKVVNDPTLGAIWQSSYTLPCVAQTQSVTFETCLSGG